ncbi:MAG: arginine--tRNA ligase [Verrucomicrobiota bacterium]|nr:arginine--tRNA ligase [Verrucomicrobiota bacterium]MDP7050219.1 arginine--tRNA ligase [Verrucomicrobiota bacterium]
MIHLVLQEKLQQVVNALMPEADVSNILVRPCPEPKFGDYQTNALIGLAKRNQLNPREFAAQVVEQLDVTEYCEPIEIAGPGFLNFRLKAMALSDSLAGAARGEHLFYHTDAEPRTVVIDYSSPNVAKPMHVGHIRSTILGYALAKVFRLLGHKVVTDNHIGDWGTQFGKLLVGWKEHLDKEALGQDALAEMERLYKLVNAASDGDEAVLARARNELVKLQDGDAENLAIWHEMIDLSRHQFDEIYSRLRVNFDETLGESFYNDRLKGVVDELIAQGIAEESEGAQVVFFNDHKSLKKHPAIVRKSDGAANYTTTDLATLEHRQNTWQPSEVIYVTDGRQQLHFQQLFALYDRWKPNHGMKFNHVWFGAILGEDGRPFKTRSGEIIRLAGLLDEAEQRAFDTVSKKNPDLPEEERNEIARVVGLGAIKYADLSGNRQSDYVFNWDTMLALVGNTAPYLLYAFTRIRSIFRKLGDESLTRPKAFALDQAEELTLAKHLLRFGLVLELVIEECRPNYLCNYLYELAGHFGSFYENCPVLQAGGDTRTQRLALCNLTGQVLQTGLETLGLETTDRM